MGRLVFTFLSAVSAVLLVAPGTLWLAGNGRGTYMSYVRPTLTARWNQIDYLTGIGVVRDPQGTAADGARLGWGFKRVSTTGPGNTSPSHNAWGFSPVTFRRTGGRTEFFVWVPTWLPVAVTAVMPAAWLVGYARRRRRGRAGHCPACGYDLRESPDGCPECGAGRAPA